MEEYDEYGLNHSFRSEEQVLILNPCDYSHLSDGSAQEATPIYDTRPIARPKPSQKPIDERNPGEKHETKKSKLFLNMFIGKKQGKTHPKGP